MAAEAEAERAAAAAGAADLGPQLGISPATPDIVRKPARPFGTIRDDGSCCTALSTAAAPAPAGPGKVESDGFSSAPSPSEEKSQPAPVGPGKVESDGFSLVPPPVGEQSQSALEDLGEVVCMVSTQESSCLPAQMCEPSGKVEQQQEGVANGSDSCAAIPAPVPTPDKVEPTPRRRWKKSIRGVPRLKVMKDKFMKVKVAPKESTPGKVKKTRKTQEDGDQRAGTGSANTARQKLDLDSSESKPRFSRAMLMGNLRCLAKSRGLRDDPSARTRSKRGKKRKLMIFKHQESGELMMVPYQSTPTGASSSALVPHAGFMQLATLRSRNHGKKLETKVLGLDEKTLQVYDVLRKWDEGDTESFEGFDIGSGPEWDEKRHTIEQCVDVFIATMYDLLGPRKFSQWGGSVIDSVVGTFLTQNVADNLSSNAFMNLAARFPPSKRCRKAEECSNVPPIVDGIDQNLNLNGASGIVDSIGSVFNADDNSEKEDGCDMKVKGHYGQEYKSLIENFIASMKQKDISTLNNDIRNLVKSGDPLRAEKTLKKFIATLQPKDTSDWDKLREEAYQKGYSNRSGTGISDAVDWESVLHAPILEIAKCIAVRGQHYLMACRIQAFLTRVKKDHGSFDLEWLRYVPRESAKNYLLSILGLGDKSVDCIRLLSLRHKAFPVDVNVARIVTRLGWVQLQPLEGSAEFHLVDLYPIMRDVQRYLWPRLCTIDKEKLYELHCLMITFGKVMCTKINPNCRACPFSAKCKYYNSSLARFSLPPAEKHEHERGEEKTSMVTSGRLLLSNGNSTPSVQQMYQHQIETSRTAERQSIRNGEPIIEMPPSPEHEYEEAPNKQEEPYESDLCDLEDIIPEGVPYDAEIDISSIKHVVNNDSWTSNDGKDLVLSNQQCHFGQNKKLKNIGRLRTEHYAYVLPDDHVILEEFEERVPEDPCPYLLVVISCPNDYTVKGTVLIPCRTATGGNFPLNGTYFQEHEVFADYSSSHLPISIPRECLWSLDRCIVYFGSSIHSITKGQTKQDIQDCYKRGYICVRGFDRITRQSKRLSVTLHVINIDKNNDRKEGSENSTKRARTSPEGKKKEKPS